MSPILDSLKKRIAAGLPALVAKGAGVTSAYYGFALMTIQAVLSDPNGVEACARGAAVGVFGNLLADQIVRWRDQTEATNGGDDALAARIEADLRDQGDLRKALDTLLQKLDVASVALQALPQQAAEQFLGDLDADHAREGSHVRIFILGSRTQFGGLHAGRDIHVQPPPTPPPANATASPTPADGRGALTAPHVILTRWISKAGLRAPAPPPPWPCEPYPLLGPYTHEEAFAGRGHEVGRARDQGRRRTSGVGRPRTVRCRQELAPSGRTAAAAAPAWISSLLGPAPRGAGVGPSAR